MPAGRIDVSLELPDLNPNDSKGKQADLAGKGLRETILSLEVRALQPGLPPHDQHMLEGLRHPRCRIPAGIMHTCC